MAWAGLEKGDAAIVVCMIGEPRERVTKATVISVGRKWITVDCYGERLKFDVEGGHGDYSTAVHTQASLDDARFRRSAIQRLHHCCWRKLSSETLAALVALTEHEYKMGR